jgi:predicted TIM-barrel fold metal-dependent hydrolase
VARDYRYISVDGHLEIKPEQWRDRVEPKHRDRAPRSLEINGATAFVVENAAPYLRTDHNPGTPPEAWTLEEFVRYEDMAGAGPPEQRLKEQDQDGIDAEVLFTGNGFNIANNIVDDDAYRAVVHGYNEFLAKDYCPTDPDRLIGLGVIPRRGVQGAIDELEHCGEIGLKGVVLSAYPSGGERPSAEDDPFWSAASASGLAVCVHGGIPTRGGGDYLATRLSLPIGRRACGTSPLAMAIDGVFDRHPNLKIFFGETDIGWIPFFMDQVDIFYRKGYHFQYLKKQGLKELDRPPTEVLKEHTYWGFMEDRLGLELLARYGHMGLDHVMWESDFPHKPTSWPNSMDQIQRIFAGFDEEDMYPMVAGNAVRYFHLDAADPTKR